MSEQYRRFLKRFIRFICVLLASVFCICQLTACRATILKPSVQKGYICFSNGTPLKSKAKVFNVDQFIIAKTLSAKYRADVFYHALSASSKAVYTALEYAMEKGYENIFIDKNLCNSPATLSEILEYLSLDSPLLEQNLRYKVGQFSGVKFEENIQFDGYYISVNNFSENLWDLKCLAIKEAEEILKSIPEDDTPIEKAERIYRILSTIEFFDYKEITNEEYDEWGSYDVFPYLYNALITGKTNCDGYSNAVSLLYNMSGIKCVEKKSKGKNEVGHTWDFFLLDNEWYNCDAVCGYLIPNTDIGVGAGMRFGFCDTLQENYPDYADFYQKAEKNLFMQIDEQLSTCDNSALFNSVFSTFKKNKNYYALIVINDTPNEQIDWQVKAAVKEYNGAVQYYLFDLCENRKAILVFRYGLFD